MSDHYEAIIIGGGHNGLVTAALLARAGRRVLLLEQRPLLGGAAATEPVWPGFQVNTGAHHAGLFLDEISQALDLAAHGLAFHESAVALFAPQPDGGALTLWGDVEKTRTEIGRFNAADANRYPPFVDEVSGMARLLREMMRLTPPELAGLEVGDLVGWGKVGLALRRLGDRPMMQFMRVLPMALAEYLDEWFASDALKGALGADGIAGNQLGPRGAGTALTMLYQHTGGFLNGRFVAGGIGQLSAALAAAAQQHGAEIRTGTAVTQILLDDDGRATGVVLAGGTSVTGRAIISNADPRRTFFDLVGPARLEPRFMKAVRNIIYRGCTAKVNLALHGLPQFNGQSDPEQLRGRIRISPSLNYLEKGYDDAKYGRISAQPYLEATIPTLHDPALAPDGYHLLSITMQYAPYRLRDGRWDDDQRQRLGDLVVDTLAAYAPNLPGLIHARQVLTPLDWEQTYGLTEGSSLHGQMGLEQLLVMRPVAGWGRYRTPIANLYLCGAGAHPGGGVTGAPGYNAAREVLAALP